MNIDEKSKNLLLHLKALRGKLNKSDLISAILSQKQVEQFSKTHSANNAENEKNNSSTKHHTSNKKHSLFLYNKNTLEFIFIIEEATERIGVLRTKKLMAMILLVTK